MHRPALLNSSNFLSACGAKLSSAIRGRQANKRSARLVRKSQASATIIGQRSFARNTIERSLDRRPTRQQVRATARGGRVRVRSLARLASCERRLATRRGVALRLRRRRGQRGRVQLAAAAY